jgi:tetratricopeptide (TPR) repeat protein
MRGRLALSGLIALAWSTTAAQPPAPDPLDSAYEALRARRYDEAVGLFRAAIDAAPGRAAARKDLAYTYLKIGEPELARDQLGEALRLEPADTRTALEYAFLCHETRRTPEARRIFDRLRKAGDAVAEQAFRNIDGPLAAGIERWTRAIAMGAENFGAHHELARLAEQRDDLALAAEHYERAWRLPPHRRSALVDLGRVWQALGRPLEAVAALLAASRGEEPHAAEAARELLPQRYPYVYEFRSAIQLDPANAALRRELAFLLLRMGRQEDAEQELRTLLRIDARDLLASTQLGFLLLARDDPAALPLLQSVLGGADEELANRVRAVLRLPQTLQRRAADSLRAPAFDAKLMADRSIRAGYLQDALRYLLMAHEADPGDFSVMYQLGWTYNNLRDDASAARWFDLARRSPDIRVAADAGRSWRNLRPAVARVRLSSWALPFYSTRWRNLFTYAQVRAEFRLPGPLRPYLTTRFVGDTRQTTGVGLPQYLSESAFIFGAGVTTLAWHGLRAWAETGAAVGYRDGRVRPDFRGGVAAGRLWGSAPGDSLPGWFFESNADGVFVSRFQRDFVVYSQNRLGYSTQLGPFETRWLWNANLSSDIRRQYWANSVESGPGLRVRWPGLAGSFLLLDFLRGAYLRNSGNPYRPNFYDLRAGFWYAFSY